MEFIKKHSPDTRFTITNKQATRGKKKNRFVEETEMVLELLKKYSEEVEKVTETYGNF